MRDASHVHDLPRALERLLRKWSKSSVIDGADRDPNEEDGQRSGVSRGGGEQMDLEGWRGINPLEHVHEIDIRIDALQSTRRDEALHDADIPDPDFRPTEEPCFAAPGNGPNLPLKVVSIERDARLREKHP